ncbi:AAA family ATPase [Candidatus Kaiserbacteria bacterium]|nr:AAA family ATPase [Candidatus Kaiserbacteria bacterium]
MAADPIDDIEKWSQDLVPWKRDVLRRLATGAEFSEADYSSTLSMVKEIAGFKLSSKPPAAIPFTKSHFAAGATTPLTLKGITNIQNINQLTANAQLDFCPKALTIIYGRNGSGKSGFARILRTACRTRIENPAKLKVLSDVYGDSSGPQAADIVIDNGSGDTSIKWTPGQTAIAELMQVAVFDTVSAQLYVDNGNQIRFLPFGLALPHRLNTVCLQLKEILEAERKSEVGNKVSMTAINFDVTQDTKAQKFERSLSQATTDTAIATAAKFTSDDEARLEEIRKALSAGDAALADLTAFEKWLRDLATECEEAEKGFSDKELKALEKIYEEARSARTAATVAAKAMFTDEPLPGVGSKSWRALWHAARDFSVQEAYVDRDFPITLEDDAAAACVLCQQPLTSDASARMKRFQKYLDDTLGVAATKAEGIVSEAQKNLKTIELLEASDFEARVEQVRKRNNSLADALATFKTTVKKRRAIASSYLSGEEAETAPLLVSVVKALTELLQKIQKEKEALEKANNAPDRALLVAEKAELEDLKTLAANKDRLTTRRDLLRLDHAYAKALTQVGTTGITRRANDLIDTHLTSAVVKQFDTERERFEIMHLKIGLARRSGQTKAEFDVSPQTKLTRVTSEILSEGEQRALALAGFLTEVELTDGKGPIVIDDPVSSLDRDRSIKVAERIAEEATKRQVIVFTHDMVFFNELSKAADSLGIEPVTVGLFRDKDAAGKVDPAGVSWKGLNVSKRIGKIKNDSASLAKLYKTSPSDYEMRVKGLYGRLRDTYERAVEEVIFNDIVRRGTDVIQTQLLRKVRLSDGLAIRFYEGMTKANTHSHDNPASDTVPVPTPDEFKNDIAAFEKLIVDLKAEGVAAEAARPQMKPKKD